MPEFTAVFVGEEDGSVDIKEEDGSVDIKEEEGSFDIKEECLKEKDPLSTTSQSTKGKKENRGPILMIWIENSNLALLQLLNLKVKGREWEYDQYEYIKYYSFSY
jgi:hypothetical protein